MTISDRRTSEAKIRGDPVIHPKKPNRRSEDFGALWLFADIRRFFLLMLATMGHGITSPNGTGKKEPVPRINPDRWAAIDRATKLFHLDDRAAPWGSLFEDVKRLLETTYNPEESGTLSSYFTDPAMKEFGDRALDTLEKLIDVLTLLAREDPVRIRLVRLADRILEREGRGAPGDRLGKVVVRSREVGVLLERSAVELRRALEVALGHHRVPQVGEQARLALADLVRSLEGIHRVATESRHNREAAEVTKPQVLAAHPLSR